MRGGPAVRWALATLFALSGCPGGEDALAPARPRDGSGAPAAAVPEVEVVAVATETLQMTTPLPGELQAFETVAIYPRVQGFLEQIPVDRGTQVKRGDLLARLSAPELLSQRTEAEARLRAAGSTFSRLKAAAATEGAVAGHEVELAEANLGAQRARVRALRSLEGYLVVRAPFDGVITERNAHPGALLGPPAGPSMPPMLRLEQVQRLRLTVAVPEVDVGSIAQGAPASFQVRAWPGERFEGVIRRVAHSIDPRTRTMPVEVDVDNAAGKLAPGMFVEVLWPVRRSGPSLLVPQSAVGQTTDKLFVDRVRDNRVEVVSIRRGLAVGARVEVVGPLRAGDLVLRKAAEELREGAPVQVKRRGGPDGGTGGPDRAR